MAAWMTRNRAESDRNRTCRIRPEQNLNAEAGEIPSRLKKNEKQRQRDHSRVKKEQWHSRSGFSREGSASFEEAHGHAPTFEDCKAHQAQTERYAAVPARDSAFALVIDVRFSASCPLA